jgi:hypothetical protein
VPNTSKKAPALLMPNGGEIMIEPLNFVISREAYSFTENAKALAPRAI